MSLRQKGSQRRKLNQTRRVEISAIDHGFRVDEVAPVLFDYTFVVSLVLGGCCANVWAYEELLKMNPRIGSALTFSQMLFITLQSLPSFLSFPGASLLPRLKPRQVPLSQWAFQVILLTMGSLLNNWAFAFDVPLTVQIVFRSAGLAVSMLFGWLFLKKRYSTMQVISVIIVSIGTILATLSRPVSRKATYADDGCRYATGVTLLGLSSLLTAALGLLQERTYKLYGPCWREGVFYTHLLSLPIFLFLVADVKQGLDSLSDASTLTPYASHLIMAANLVSQLICVSSVNRLTSQVSSVSTNLVLTTRKSLSLCFSVWWFGNGWNPQLGIGAGMVFLGSFMFNTKPSRENKDE